MTEMTRIDVTDVDLRELIKAAYDLSRPVGLGRLHYRAGELDDETIDDILGSADNYNVRLCMDYVHGRAVKLTVLKDLDGGLYICNPWFDHSARQLGELLNRVGVEVEDAKLKSEDFWA